MTPITLPNLAPPRMTLTPSTILELPAFFGALRPASSELAFEVERRSDAMVLSIREPHGPILAVVDVPRRYRNADQFFEDPLLWTFSNGLAVFSGAGRAYGIDPKGKKFYNPFYLRELDDLDPADREFYRPRGPEESVVRRGLIEIAARFRVDGSYDRTGLDEREDIERLSHDDPDAAPFLLDASATYSRVFKPRDLWCAVIRHRVWRHYAFGQGATPDEALDAARAVFSTRWTVSLFMSDCAAKARTYG
jgi:hypothetical protein